MRYKTMKHSKIRNTGLLYEFLIRQITGDILDNNNSEAINIIKKRFNENTELGKELGLYNILISKKFKSDKKAEYFINQVIKERKDLNNTQLKREKYNLIKILKETYDLKKLFSSKVKDYKIYASVYTIFENSKLSPEQKTEMHFNLVEHVTTDDNNINLKNTVANSQISSDDLRILTYKTLLEKFNSKYSKLNLPQKNLLRAYINNVSGTNSLKEYIEKIVPVIISELKKYSKNLKDEVVKIKMNEAIKSIDKFCGVGKSEVVKDIVVVQTMRYMELLKELKKRGNKKQKVL